MKNCHTPMNTDNNNNNLFVSKELYNYYNIIILYEAINRLFYKYVIIFCVFYTIHTTQVLNENNK